MPEPVRYPAEWEKQDAILLAWPKPSAGWEHHYNRVQDDYATLVATILRYEPVILCIHPDDHRSDIENRIAAKRIPLYPLTIVELDGDDSWARDFGPISIETGSTPGLLDFQFNGWGKKYPSEKDNQVSPSLARTGLIQAPETLPLVMEGGSLESNGDGMLMTTSRCLLHKDRNPHYAKSDYEQYFLKHMGIQKTLWLDHGWLAGDDTDGHIDNLARFVNENAVVYTHCSDADDEHFPELDQMRQELESFKNLEGEPLKLVSLPFPTPCYSEHNERLPASYANFLIINDAVLCPVYDVMEDDEALQTLQRLFPDRTVEAVPARHFIHQGGSVHCLSMQLLRGTVL